MKTQKDTPEIQKFRKTKTALLICLIVLSLALSSYVWFSEELWPGGYNFFIMLKDNIPIARQLFEKDVYSMPKENLSKPQKIVVTNGEKRAVYSNGNSSFNSLHDIIKPFLADTLRREDMVTNKQRVSEDEWFNVLRNDELLDTRSIYVNYSLAYSPSLFARMIGIRDTWISQDISAVKEFVAAPVKEDEMLLYVRDGGNNEIYKYFVSYSGASGILAAVDKYTAGSELSAPFSFELNLNRNTGGIGEGIVQKVFLNSMITVSTGSAQSAVAQSENPLREDGAAPDAIYGVFKNRSGITRRYTDSAGIQYFVENYSVLKIYPEGLIEYHADNESLGVDISDESVSLYESLNRAIEFSEKVWAAAAPDEAFNVLVTSDLLESEGAVYHFTLDYYYEGVPVTVEVASDKFENMNHAVEIDVKNGRIIKYRHFIRKYKKTGKTVTNPSSIEALDSIYKKYASAEEETYIADIFLSYIENGGISEKSPVWCAKLQGTDETVY